MTGDAWTRAVKKLEARARRDVYRWDRRDEWRAYTTSGSPTRTPRWPPTTGARLRPSRWASPMLDPADLREIGRGPDQRNGPIVRGPRPPPGRAGGVVEQKKHKKKENRHAAG